ncbi:SMCO4 protein, partial [Polypterus senegalus]
MERTGVLEPLSVTFKNHYADLYFTDIFISLKSSLYVLPEDAYFVRFNFAPLSPQVPLLILCSEIGAAKPSLSSKFILGGEMMLLGAGICLRSFGSKATLDKLKPSPTFPTPLASRTGGHLDVTPDAEGFSPPYPKMRQLKGKPKKETSKDKKERKQAMQEARQQIATVVLPTLAVVVLLIVVFVYVATRPGAIE